MKFIEIALGDVSCRALLQEEKAPNTAAAIWSALPFGGTAVHAQVSGQMFRMLEGAPVPELEVESGERHQHPGQVVFYPPIKEIAFCVGEAQFSGTYGGKYSLTPLAEIEHDFTEWAQVGDDLQYTGARPIRFEKAKDQSTPFRFPPLDGRRLRIDLGDVSVVAGLLPSASSAVGEWLGGAAHEGRASNSTWAGPITRLAIPGLTRVPDAVDGATTFHWPGYVYYDPRDGSILVCYGDAEEGIQGNPVPLIPIARIAEGLPTYAREASRQLMEGVKPVRLELL
jgi:hypothetical protein